MPKLKSAKKRLRQDKKKKTQNRVKKDAYKELKRQIKKTVQGEKTAKSLEDLASKFSKAVDKAAKVGTIHKNKAAREKASVMAFIRRKTAAASQKSLPSKAAKKSGKAKAPKVGKKKSAPRKAK